MTTSETNGEVTINKNFIDFIQLHSTTGLNMTEILLKKLKEFQIPLENMRVRAMTMT